jgi:hypothetical protein
MSDEIEFRGPAMRALTEKQQRYVLAMLADPFGNPTKWARAAGYSDASGGAKVKAHYLSHDPRIEAAVQEVARTALNGRGPLLGLAVVMRAAANPKDKNHFKAGVALLNRTGFHETTEHHVNVNHTDGTGQAMVARIKDLAGALGMDPAALLGVNAMPAEPMKLIEGEVVEEKS